jgi:ABC-2 type transport system ATP-binding protein
VDLVPDDSVAVRGMTSAAVGELIAHEHLIVHELTPVRASLEDAFMELTRDSVEFHVHDDADGDDQSPASRAGDRLAPVER